MRWLIRCKRLNHISCIEPLQVTELFTAEPATPEVEHRVRFRADSEPKFEGVGAAWWSMVQAEGDAG